VEHVCSFVSDQGSVGVRVRQPLKTEEHRVLPIEHVRPAVGAKQAHHHNKAQRNIPKAEHFACLRCRRLQHRSELRSSLQQCIALVITKRRTKECLAASPGLEVVAKDIRMPRLVYIGPSPLAPSGSKT